MVGGVLLDKSISGYNQLFLALQGKELSNPSATQISQSIENICSNVAPPLREAAKTDLDEIFEPYLEEQTVSPDFKTAVTSAPKPEASKPLKPEYRRDGWAYYTKANTVGCQTFPVIPMDYKHRDTIIKAVVEGHESFTKEERDACFNEILPYLRSRLEHNLPIENLRKALRIFPDDLVERYIEENPNTRRGASTVTTTRLTIAPSEGPYYRPKGG